MSVKKKIDINGEHNYAISGKNIIVRSDRQKMSAQDLSELAEKAKAVLNETEKGINIVEIEDTEKPQPKYEVKTLRQAFADSKDEEETFRMSRARALATWNARTKYCCQCGTELTDAEELTAKVCKTCNRSIFPQIEPCMIVLVNKGDKILLARHAQRNTVFYSCLAGFIEAGESAEHAVAREIEEEVGIKVKNIKYRGSQSWPFPDQLMLAFTAEYESGEIKKQEDEIADAQWFDRSDLPTTPNPGSIAYKLIHQEI